MFPVLFSLVSAHHRTVREEYGDKVKMRPWSRSPLRQQRDKLEQADSRKPGSICHFIIVSLGARRSSSGVVFHYPWHSVEGIVHCSHGGTPGLSMAVHTWCSCSLQGAWVR